MLWSILAVGERERQVVFNKTGSTTDCTHAHTSVDTCTSHTCMLKDDSLQPVDERRHLMQHTILWVKYTGPQPRDL